MLGGNNKVNEYEVAELLFRQLRENPASSLSDVLTEFNRGEIGVLSYLAFDKDRALAGELSEKLNVTTARIASILNSLESKEYINRKEDDLDKRKTLVVITEKGKRLADEAKTEVMKKIVKVIREIGCEEIKDYLRIVLKIKKVLNEE